MMIQKKINTVLIMGCILFILFIFFLNHYTLLVADDFSYAIGINSISDIVVSQYNHYFNWGGRSIAHFLVQFWLLVGKPLFNIANTIVYSIFILLVQFHITGNRKKIQLWLFLALNLIFWFLIPVWGQNFIWLTGSCNYLWTTTIILFFLVPYRLKYDNSEYKITFLCSLLFFLLGILAGWSNENSGSAVLVFLIVYISIKMHKKVKFVLFEILGIIGFLIGFVLLISAPGNYARAEAEYQISSNNFLFIMNVLERFLSITFTSLQNYSLLILIVSIFIIFDLQFHKKQKVHGFSYYFIIAALAGLYSMVLSPVFPLRVYFIVYVFGVIALGNILGQMQLSMPGIIKRNFPIIIICAMLFLSFSFLQAGRNIVGTYIRWYDFIVNIQTETKNGNYIIEANPFAIPLKHNATYGIDDVFKNLDYWLNVVASRYFGIESIIGVDGVLDRLSFNRRTINQLLIPPWAIIRAIRFTN